MATSDTCVTIVPYFKVHAGKRGEAKVLCDECVERTRSEPKCLFYGFSFDNDEMHCREGYADAKGALAHLENIDPLLKKLLRITDLTRLEVHGPAAELDQLRKPMAGLNPKFFVLEYGFRK